MNSISDERGDKLLCFTKEKRDAESGQSGYDYYIGVSCALSSLYLIALRTAAELADTIGKQADAANMRGRIPTLKKSILEAFWRTDKNLFADAIVADKDTDTFSVNASFGAWMAGVVPEESRPEFKENLARLITPIFKNGFDPADGATFHPAYGFYFFNQLYQNGMAEIAENCIKTGWGWQLAQGLKTTIEHFTIDTGSRCHAWTASPTYMLSRYALGVKCDIDTGLDNVVIDIMPGSLQWAKGVYPHAKGPVSVAWHKENGCVVVDKIEVPDGVRVTVQP